MGDCGFSSALVVPETEIDREKITYEMGQRVFIKNIGQNA